MKIHCLYDELIPIRDLKPHPKNRNTHPKDQIDRLAKIIGFQGVRSPIKVSNRSGFITAGHGRLEAFKKLNLKKVPVNFQDYDSEEQEYADLQSDNAIALWAELDLSDIKLDLSTLKDFDIDLLGIRNLELNPKPGLTEEDAIPEQVEPNAKLGELYQLGEHRLLCGDSTIKEDVEMLMNGQLADMVFTDPPYGMNLDTDYRSMGSKNNFKPIIGDNLDFTPELIETLLGIFSYCPEIFLFGADYYAELIGGRNDGSWIVWDKRSHGEENIGTLDGSFGADFELCWSKSKHQRKMCRVIRNKGAFIKLREGATTLHPSQKPVEMVVWFFELWGKPQDNVVDLFLGSGSTLIACEKTKRKCYGMEIDPHYCDVIIKRWEDYTGKKAEKISV